MATINIRRDVNDSFYRYKMPRLQCKIEGKGNGIKTVIPNMSDVAKALHRPPSYPTKYFGYEVGAQTKIDEAKDRYIINGSHDVQKFQDILDGFITRFVLCPECMNPETDLQVTKDGDIKRDCKACGKISSVDMRHKLCAFIVKNPPGVTAGARYASSSKKDKKQQQQGAEESAEDDDLVEEEEDSNILDRKMQAETANLPKNGEIKSSLDDWSVDTSTEAMAARQKEMNNLSERIAKKMNMVEGGGDDEDDEGGDGNDPLEALAEFIESESAGDEVSASITDILKKVKELGIREDKAIAVLTQTLLCSKSPSPQPSQIVAKLKKYQKLFAYLIHHGNDEKCQKALLGGIERVVAIVHANLLAKVAIILKALYDLDLIDEEMFIAWGKKPSKKYVDKELSKEIRKKAQPFLEWLENADEEESESDDE